MRKFPIRYISFHVKFAFILNTLHCDAYRRDCGVKFQTLQLFAATCGRNLLTVKNLEHENCKGWFHVKKEKLFYSFLTFWKLCYVYLDRTCVHASKWRWRVCLFPGWLERDLEETAGCPMTLLISTAWPPQLRQPDSIMVSVVTLSLSFHLLHRVENYTERSEGIKASTISRQRKNTRCIIMPLCLLWKRHSAVIFRLSERRKSQQRSRLVAQIMLLPRSPFCVIVNIIKHIQDARQDLSVFLWLCVVLNHK